jgi:hypothetical protein
MILLSLSAVGPAARVTESAAPSQPQGPARSERPGRPERNDAISMHEAPAPAAKYAS